MTPTSSRPGHCDGAAQSGSLGFHHGWLGWPPRRSRRSAAGFRCPCPGRPDRGAPLFVLLTWDGDVVILRSARASTSPCVNGHRDYRGADLVSANTSTDVSGCQKVLASSRESFWRLVPATASKVSGDAVDRRSSRPSRNRRRSCPADLPAPARCRWGPHWTERHRSRGRLGPG